MSWRGDKRKTAERGYGGRWQRERRDHLAKNPLCVLHEERGDVVAGTVVDHRIPHRGDPVLFWNRSNWQTLCKPCHDSIKQALERSGSPQVRVGLDGFPIDSGGAGGE